MRSHPHRGSVAGRVVVVTPHGRGGDGYRFLTDHAAELGYESALVQDDVTTVGVEDLLVVCGNLGWYPGTRAGLAALPVDKRPRTVVWHSEPLPLPSTAPFPREPLTTRERVKQILRHRGATDPATNARHVLAAVRSGIVQVVAPTSRGSVEYLAEHGVDAVRVPRGIDSRDSVDLGLRRDLDVVFLGAMVRRRRKAIRRLDDMGVRVLATGGWGRKRVSGEERTRLLNRTKVLLNLQRFPGQYSGLRLLLGIANGAVPVSEPIYSPEPFVPGVHYVEAALEDFPEAVAGVLADDAGRHRMVEQGRVLAARLTRKATFAELLAVSGRPA